MSRWFFLPVVMPFLAAGAQQPTAATGDSLHAITLDEAVTLARRNSPGAVQARGQLTTAASGIRSAYGAFLPSLSATMTQGKQGGQQWDQLRGPVSTPFRPWQYRLGFNSSLQLFDGGRRFTDLSEARAVEDAAEANQVTQSFSIALQVKREYANILAARESEAAARTQLEQAEAQLRAAVSRVQAGAATRSDSLRSVILVGNARLALLTAQNNVRIASASLTRLVGTPFLVTANPADTAEVIDFAIDSAALVDLAAHGPTVVQAERNAAAARAGERGARSAYLPTISASFGYNGNSQDSSYKVTFGPYAYGWNFSTQLSLPIFNNWNREDQIVRARVARDNAEALLRDARLAAQQSIVQQFGALRTAEERIRIQQASVTAAEEDLRVMQQRYTLGASTLLDLLTSQSQLNQARAALIQARQDYRVARAQIEAIIGRDLS
jgi:outer membrane protein